MTSHRIFEQPVKRIHGVDAHTADCYQPVTDRKRALEGCRAVDLHRGDVVCVNEGNMHKSMRALRARGLGGTHCRC